jgi:hypothetical protein
MYKSRGCPGQVPILFLVLLRARWHIDTWVLLFYHARQHRQPSVEAVTFRVSCCLPKTLAICSGDATNVGDGSIEN